MCNDNKKSCSCLAKLLQQIVILQQIDNPNGGCTQPFLGGNNTNYNTRPLSLYACCSNAIWTLPYNSNGTQGESTFFRVESINENCATFRILIRSGEAEPYTYTATNNFFTIDLNCVGSIKCHGDTLITNL